MHLVIFGSYSASWNFGEGASQPITRLFLRNGCDIHEAYQLPLEKHPFQSFLYPIEGAVESPGKSEEPIWRDKSHSINIWLHFLSDQNVDGDFAETASVLMSGSTLLQGTIIAQSFKPELYKREITKAKFTEAIFMLCSLGANVSARLPDSGAQPLHLVAEVPYSLEDSFHCTAQFEILLKFGADPCARDGLGRTVTHIACSSGWKQQWFQALCECNKAKVVIEQIRAELAGWKDAPLDDAIRTGVDVSDLSKPSLEGLSRRIAARGDRLDD